MNITVGDYTKNLIRTSPFQREANLRYAIWRINNPCYGMNLMKFLRPPTEEEKEANQRELVEQGFDKDEIFEWNLDSSKLHY